ncbi:MAG TPA: hypothetical protein VD969_10960 [Symbiobacteriaceae bacterium]|nr:hypothetical protein [Symbiobacteriaceae bacterium]
MPQQLGLALLAATCLLAGCSQAPVPTPAPLPPEASQIAHAAARWRYSALDFRDELHGWIALTDGGAGPGAVIRSADGGITWLRTGAPAFDIGALRFTDEAHGTALGTSLNCRTKGTGCTLIIAGTADSGATWETRFSHALADGTNDHAPVLEFLNGGTGYALYVGSRESVLVMTADAGQSWQSLPSPAPGWNIMSAAFANANLGWVLARECTAAGEQDQCRYAVFATEDGGKRWVQQLALPDGRRIRPGSMSFVDARHGWLYPTAPTAGCSLSGCAGPIYRTEDGGKTWGEISWAGARDYAGFALSVRFVSHDRGWMLISGGTSSGIGTTADGGMTWTRYLLEGLQDVQMLSAPSAEVAWAVGAGPGGAAVLVKTVDGGKTWTPVPVPQLD